MEYIKGKYKSSIFKNDSNGYQVGLFKVKESSSELESINGKTLTFTGYFRELNTEDTYIMYGKYVFHDRYGYQFQVSEYERCEPDSKEAVMEFLSSSFVKGCGEKTAKKIVEKLGSNAINLIKEDKNNLLNCGISKKSADKIYDSIISYYDQDEIIIYLKELDFSVKEITLLLNMFGNKIKDILNNDLYSLIDYIDFKKLDRVYFHLFETTNDMRIMACVIESIKNITFETGDTYSYKDEIISYMREYFQIDLDEIFDEVMESLVKKRKIVIYHNKYYLYKTYQDELYISYALYDISFYNTSCLHNFDNLLESVEQEYNITYNEEQKNAIKTVMDNSITIITGGPGTGKTTIVNGIIRMYQLINMIPDSKMNQAIALLAPTGRASKRLAETTNFGSMTIHRYLKWNHETKEFGINEYNKNEHRLIIVDEVSMIDNELMASLLHGIEHDCKVVFVGDEFQLPSVAQGNVLKDIIASDMFAHVRLKNIYRQSDNSFIPILAREIKNVSIESDLRTKKDDYNFLECKKSDIKSMLSEIILMSIDKGLSEKNVQILAPMYKGENGIDNLNIILQELFNPKTNDKASVKIGPVEYRENDKVLNLVNNIEQNIFNGDIGYIKKIDENNSQAFMVVDYYGNQVTYKREEVGTIRHAYAMSIHKSQGSEFNHVIIPITKEFNRMLYNKLLYTGISRAKKSLVIIGDIEAFLYAVNNSYSVERKTSLTEFIMNKFNNINS